MGNSLPPHLNTPTSVRSSLGSFFQDIISNVIGIYAMIAIIVMVKMSWDAGEILFESIGLVSIIPLLVTFIYLEFRHLDIPLDGEEELSFRAIIIQKFAVYICIGIALFAGDIITQIEYACFALALKSFHIVQTGKRANVFRKGKHIATKTGIFLAIPFVDIIKWEDLPQETIPTLSIPGQNVVSQSEYTGSDTSIRTENIEYTSVCKDKQRNMIHYMLKIEFEAKKLSFYWKKEYKNTLQRIIKKYLAQYTAQYDTHIFFSDGRNSKIANMLYNRLEEDTHLRDSRYPQILRVHVDISLEKRYEKCKVVQ